MLSADLKRGIRPYLIMERYLKDSPQDLLDKFDEKAPRRISYMIESSKFDIIMTGYSWAGLSLT